MRCAHSTKLLLVILVLALGLRLWGAGFGLPDVYHPDEERIVNHALAFGLGDFNPHYFNYPSFSMYLLFFEYGIYYLIGHFVGIFPDAEALQRLFFSDVSSFYLIGRITTAILGTATVWLVYILGEKAYGKIAGLAAAFFFGINFLHVESSHYIATDILLTFFIAASYINILSIYRTGRLKSYIWAGIFAGLGAASKYNAATLAVPLLLAHWWSAGHAGNGSKLVGGVSNPDSQWNGLGLKKSSHRWTAGLRERIFQRNLWVAAGCMLGAFFIASPFVFLDFSKFLADFRGISEHMKVGVYSTGGGSQWLNYLALFIRDPLYLGSIHWNTLGIVYAVALLWALLKSGKREWLLLVYPVFYFLFIGNFGVCNPRYIIPVFPFLAVLSGGALAALWNRNGIMVSGRAAIVGAIMLLSILPIRNIISNDILLSRTDTRTLARDWVEATIPEGTIIALEWDNNGTVQLQESNDVIREKIQAYRDGSASTIHHTSDQMLRIHRMRLEADRGKTYDIVRIGEVEGLTPIPYLYDIEKLRERGTEYLIISSSIYSWFQSEKGREKYPVHAAFYDKLFSKYEPVKIFAPENQPGPVIRVYRLKDVD